MSTSEEVLSNLVGGDQLVADEEEVLEAVVEWIKGGAGEEGRGEKILGETRYGLLEELRLAEVVLRAKEIVGGRHGARLRALADEALALLQLPVVELEVHHVLPCRNAFQVRKGEDVEWGDYAGGRRQHRLLRDKRDAWSLCESGGRVLGVAVGLNGIGRLWRICRHDDYCLRCGTLRRAAAIMSYGVVSITFPVWPHGGNGSCDKTVKIWSTEGAGSRSCLGTIVVHTRWVLAIVGREGRVISGSSDEKTKVSDIVTRQHEDTFDSHIGSVRALAGCNRTLLSTGED